MRAPSGLAFAARGLLRALARPPGKRTRRFLSSATSRFEPLKGQRKRKALLVGGLNIEGAPSGAPRAAHGSASPLRGSRAALGNGSAVPSAPRPLGFEPPGGRRERKGLSSREALSSKVRRQGLALAARGRLRALARPRTLSWQTLARLRRFATSRFEPPRGDGKEKPSWAEGDNIKGAPSGAPVLRTGTLRRTPCGLRAPLGNGSAVPSAPRPLGFEPPRGRRTRKALLVGGLYVNGAPSGARTLGLGIKSPLLFQLS